MQLPLLFHENLKIGASNYWDTCGSPVIKCLCFFVVMLITRAILMMIDVVMHGQGRVT